MARTCLPLLMLLLVIFTSSTNSRKLLHTPDSTTKTEATPTEMSLYLSSLPKGTVPASGPSKKGHVSTNINEKLITRHLIAIDRILRGPAHLIREL
uniref:precursor of CEP14-like n=1 Tax=Erigeron canadensis TaxID=72917 RepID=UPI001CB983DA|nr:precursor of CEP14-like [Erigeron canadensis]